MHFIEKGKSKSHFLFIIPKRGFGDIGSGRCLDNQAHRPSFSRSFL